jgi:two-component system, chemotaxis family, CheB/CheR fusion protein
LRGVRTGSETDAWVVDVTVRPLPHPGETPLLLIVFQERTQAPSDLPGAEQGPEHGQEQGTLSMELQQVKTTLRATIENLMISGEELQTTNEEFQTIIEELQSANEELMTSKEELQSVNEELITTNSEHQRVITDLAHANTDIRHLLESSEIATLFLGSDLTIKRFTPKLFDLLSLRPADLGRHVGDIVVKIKDEQFVRDVQGVLSTLRPLERQVESLAGHLYLMRLNPAHTLDEVAGVVATFTNIDAVRTLEAQTAFSEQSTDALLDLSALPMVIFDDDLQVVTVNRALRDAFRLTGEVTGQRLFELGQRQFDREDLRSRVDELVLTDQTLHSFVMDLELPERGIQKTKVEAWSVIGSPGTKARHILTLENVTPLFGAVLEHGAGFVGDVKPHQDDVGESEQQDSAAG